MQANNLDEAPSSQWGSIHPSDDPADALFESLLGLMRLLRNFTPEIMPLPWAQFIVLRRLARSPGDVRLTGVADGLGHDISVMSRHITALIDDGLVARVRDPNDGRAWLLHLTETGQARLNEASGRCLAIVREAVSTFSDDDLALGARLISELDAQMTQKLRDKVKLAALVT